LVHIHRQVHINFVLFLGNGVGNNNIQPQELERPIVAPGDNDYERILPGFRADIPEKVKNGMYLFPPIQML
jgi:hypothetical protein